MAWTYFPLLLLESVELSTNRPRGNGRSRTCLFRNAEWNRTRRILPDNCRSGHPERATSKHHNCSRRASNKLETISTGCGARHFGICLRTIERNGTSHAYGKSRKSRSLCTDRRGHLGARYRAEGGKIVEVHEPIFLMQSLIVPDSSYRWWCCLDTNSKRLLPSKLK